MKRNFILLLGSLVATCHVQAQSHFIKDSLDAYIQREMKRWNLPGLALAVVKDGKVVSMKGYGLADVEHKTACTEKTVFQIASNSKAFTGTSLALLEHYKRLALNEPVKRYLPYFSLQEEWRGKQATIADLLCHRLGYATFQTDLINWASTKTRRELIENMANVTLAHGFRETFGYCNVGYLAAGEIVKAASDTTWDDYIRYHYFQPLEMTQSQTTYQALMNTPKEHLSRAYTLVNGKIEELVPANVDNLAPAAGISSSVSDLSHWLLMQLQHGMYAGKQVIPEAVIDRTRESFFIDEPQSRPGSNFNTYGLGWFLKDAYGKKVVTHDGGANGFLSKTVLIPEQQAGFVILTNSDAQYFYEALGKVLTDDLLGRPYTDYSRLYYSYFQKNRQEEQASIDALENSAKRYKAAKDAYTKLAGLYTNPVYGQIAVEAKEREAEVSFQFHPQYKGRLRLISDSTALIDYNDPTLGTHEVHYTASSLDIKVSDFLDMDIYPFTKIGSVFKPFPAK